MMIIYKVTESKGYDESTGHFFGKEEDARTFMKHKADKYMDKRPDLYVNVDVPRHLHLRFGDPDDLNGLFTMFDIDEIIVY